MNVIIQLYKSKSLEVKDNWVNFIIFIYNGKNSGKSIVRNIHFYNELNIGDLVHNNRNNTFFSKLKIL